MKVKYYNICFLKTAVRRYRPVGVTTQTNALKFEKVSPLLLSYEIRAVLLFQPSALAAEGHV